MEIRRARKKDLENAGKLMLEEFSKPPFNEDSSLDEVLESLNFYFKLGEIYVAEEDEIEGVVVFKVEQWWQGPVIIIEDLAANSEEVEKELLEKVESYANENDIVSINFITHQDSPDIEFLKNRGYEVKDGVIEMGKRVN